MTPQDIASVQKSYAAAYPRKAELAAAFYDELFAARPDVRPLFREDLTVQREKLVQTLTLVVRNLHLTDRLVPAAEDLARRHVGYGVTADHYPAVGAALLAALDRIMGDRFTDELRASWTAAYAGLSSIMLRAAAEGGAAIASDPSAADTNAAPPAAEDQAGRPENER